MASVIEQAGDILIYTGNFVQGITLKLVGQIWGGDEAKRKQREREEASRRAYNAALKDRTATTIDSESAYVYVYGRARVGSAVVAILTSGGRDEYKHLVCVHAAHECDAFEEIYINGKPLGALDGNGNVTAGDYVYITHPTAFDMRSGGSFALSHTPDAGSLRVWQYDNESNSYVEFHNYTLAGSVVTISGVPSYYPYQCSYIYTSVVPRVRVKKFLGAPGEQADATTIAEVPGKWDSTKKLSGMCYTIIRLDLNYADFQSGIPTIQVLLRGKKLHDVRSVSYPNDVPVWSQNPVLMLADYLSSEMCGVPVEDLPLADFITAANVCDEDQSFGKRYTANGTVTSDQSQSQVLEKMAQAMAGSITSTTWGVSAGKYVAPVMALSQVDIVGDMSYTPGTAESDLYNGVKGQYISPLNNYVPTDFQPYQIAAYVAADGSELWTDIDFMFTDDKQRIHNLCRIYVEDQRNSFTIKAAFSYKCWALQVGQRITFSSTLLGQSNKVYRVVNKTYSADSAVQLTLKEDAPEIWDFADAVVEDQTPNTDLPNPLVVATPGNLLVSEELYETSGSAGVKAKAILTWEAPADVNVLDYEIEFKKYSEPHFLTRIFSVNLRAEILDITAGKYDFRLRARNNLNIYSDYTSVKTATVYGLTSIPGNVTGFSVRPFNGVAICKWDKTTDLDVKIGGDVEIRFCPLLTGASWEQSIVLPDGEYNGDATTATVSLASGTYYIKFIDSTGNYSATPASFVVTESLISSWNVLATSVQHPLFTGLKTGCVMAEGVLKLDGMALIDDIGPIDSAGYIDSLGGLYSTGVYEFDAVMDLLTIATRRFHAHIKAYSYNASDLIDTRTDPIDSWADIDGEVINDTSATVFASVSNDGITYSNWMPFMVADFNCRYAKFKVELINADATHNIDLSELSVTAKLPI